MRTDGGCDLPFVIFRLLFCRIFVANYDIRVKFGVQTYTSSALSLSAMKIFVLHLEYKQILATPHVFASKITVLVKFKMAAATILDLDFGHILIASEDTLVKFGVQIDIGHSNSLGRNALHCR